MKRQQGIAAAMLVLALVGGVPLANAATTGEGVTVALTPTQQVALGATFDVYIDVTEAGALFNAFDAIIGYDPAALTYVSHQEGSYMTNACGNTFQNFKPGVGVDTIGDALMCAGVSLPGPGRIYQLRFQASATPQVTRIRFLPGLHFYRAGVYVTPVNSTDAYIGIGMPVDVPPAGSPTQLTLAAAPNPSHGALVFTVTTSRAGPETLTVFDVQGRAVRRFTGRQTEPGTHTVAWDGRDDAGVMLGPGVYHARLEIAGHAVWRRVTLIR